MMLSQIGALFVLIAVAVNAIDEKKVKITGGLQSKRELSEDEQRVDDIMHTLQGTCVKSYNEKSVKQLKKDTQAILDNIGIYRDIVKMNKQLRNEIKWIIEESKGPKEITRIINLLKQDVHAICKPKNIRRKDCTELKKLNMKSGVYTIYPNKVSGIKVFCDMDNNGGGWTVLQRRMNGKIDFQKDWVSYKNGFGDLNGEFWLGNDNMHELTKNGKYKLRIDLEHVSGAKGYAEYSVFSVGDASSKYKLNIGGYSGTIGDAMRSHNGNKFTTKDQDNDTYGRNCAINLRSGGWWYWACAIANLNGVYGKSEHIGIYWQSWTKRTYNLKTVSMKVKFIG